MKKIFLLSIVLMAFNMIWASDPSHAAFKPYQKAMPNPPGAAKPATSQVRPSAPARRALRAGSLQKVVIGKSGNMFTVLESKCHQLDANGSGVVFVHRSDTVTGLTTSNFAQYRYDVSKDGGSTWKVNIGPLNPRADNITINGRYPQAVIMADAANPTVLDSAYLIYNGSWHSCAASAASCPWNGQLYGTAQLSGNPATFTDDTAYINNSRVVIATSMVQSRPGYFFNLNLDFFATGGIDSVKGIWLERGIWNATTKKVDWTYEFIPLQAQPVFSAAAAVTGFAISNGSISFDPTGRYGWIMVSADINADNNFSFNPVVMSTSDYGATWSAPSQVYLENLPGMFPNPTAIANGGKTLLGSTEVVTDSLGNPHIFATVAITDTTSNQYANFFPFQEMVIYDINYNPAVVGCGWQANLLSRIFSFSADYTGAGNCSYCIPSGTQTAAHENNRIQIARNADATKMFVFWNETDSAVAFAAGSGGGTDQTNAHPNLMGIGIDLSSQKTTNVVNFTAGDLMFGGQITGGPGNGTLGGSLFPVVSQSVRIPSVGNYNIPVVLTEPDYLNATTKFDGAASRFWYCQNINFAQSDFINRYNNTPPTLTVNGPDTVRLHVDSIYNAPTATAFDCIAGNIIPQYVTNVPMDASNHTTTVGVYTSTWTATNPANGSSATHRQVVIVAAKPIARFVYTQVNGSRFNFTDSSLNFPTNRVWTWGDNSTNIQNATNPIHVYSINGPHCVKLTVTNSFGQDTVTHCLTVSLGINDVAVSNEINVYPNPSNGNVTIDFMDEIKDGATVTVFDMIGNVVNAPVAIKANTVKSELNLNTLPVGAYMMKIETSKGTAIKGITIAK